MLHLKRFNESVDKLYFSNIGKREYDDKLSRSEAFTTYEINTLKDFLSNNFAYDIINSIDKNDCDRVLKIYYDNNRDVLGRRRIKHMFFLSKVSDNWILILDTPSSFPSRKAPGNFSINNASYKCDGIEGVIELFEDKYLSKFK